LKALITGICGFVGSTLARALTESSTFDEIVGVDNFSRAGSELNRRPVEALGIRVLAGDIRNPSDVDALPQVDWVIDCAANPSVLAGVDGKTSSRQLVEHNLSGTINVLEYCKRHSAGFALLSTSRVYSIAPIASLTVESVNDAFVPVDDGRLPVGVSRAGVSEAFSTAPPVSLYGSTKVASEHLALEYGATFGFPVWVNRCGVMAGAGQFGHPAQGIFAYWIHSFREGRPLKYIGFGGEGHQVRDCLHPRDLIPLLRQQFAEPLDSSHPRIVNVSGGIENSMSLRQLSAWCEGRFGPKKIAAVAETRAFDIPWMVLDASLARSTWNWRPQTAIEQVLQEIADHADENPDWLARCA
jgi:CDP-paratose 2-epimerase